MKRTLLVAVLVMLPAACGGVDRSFGDGGTTRLPGGGQVVVQTDGRSS